MAPVTNKPSVNITREYKKLLDWLDKSLRKKDLGKMIYMADIPAGEGEKLDRPFKLFAYMEGDEKLSESNTQELLYLLDTASRKDLKKYVVEYQKKTKTSTTAIQGSSMDTYSKETKKSIPSEMNEHDPPSYSSCLVNKLEVNISGAQKIGAEELSNQPSFYKSPTPSESMDYEMINESNSVPQPPGFHNIKKYTDRYGLDFYPMESNPRGICLIISNSNFEKSRNTNIQLEDRPGSKIDLKNLYDTFKKLLFDVIIQEDLEGAELYRQTMKYAFDIDHEKYNCFVCVMMSHGNEYGVYGVDGVNQDIQNLTRPFGETKSLHGKPKLFFFQACRGNTNCVSKDASESLPMGFSNLGKRTHSSPSNSDFFYGFATPPGYTAWLSDKHGSWYISALCQALAEKSKICDINDISIRCNSIVAKHITDNMEKQIPNPDHTLTKKLYFFPENILI